jgi:hypothetical protein
MPFKKPSWSTQRGKGARKGKSTNRHICIQWLWFDIGEWIFHAQIVPV